ncbi:hypothetical protein HWV62_22606 [Athelia sp. TMB]|nr:hypothetical protein HWV62_22606 [Athelia sp. TMB]
MSSANLILACLLPLMLTATMHLLMLGLSASGVVEEPAPQLIDEIAPSHADEKNGQIPGETAGHQIKAFSDNVAAAPGDMRARPGEPAASVNMAVALLSKAALVGGSQPLMIGPIAPVEPSEAATQDGSTFNTTQTYGHGKVINIKGDYIAGNKDSKTQAMVLAEITNETFAIPGERFSSSFKGFVYEKKDALPADEITIPLSIDIAGCKELTSKRDAHSRTAAVSEIFAVMIARFSRTRATVSGCILILEVQRKGNVFFYCSTRNTTSGEAPETTCAIIRRTNHNIARGLPHPSIVPDFTRAHIGIITGNSVVVSNPVDLHLDITEEHFSPKRCKLVMKAKL